MVLGQEHQIMQTRWCDSWNRREEQEIHWVLWIDYLPDLSVFNLGFIYSQTFIFRSFNFLSNFSPSHLTFSFSLSLSSSFSHFLSLFFFWLICTWNKCISEWNGTKTYLHDLESKLHFRKTFGVLKLCIVRCNVIVPFLAPIPHPQLMSTRAEGSTLAILPPLDLYAGIAWSHAPYLFSRWKPAGKGYVQLEWYWNCFD